MFVSPCTLRSAQCAALIALATAAGLARTNPALTNHGNANPAITPAPAARASLLTAESRTSPGRFFLAAPSVCFASPAPVGHSRQSLSTLAIWFYCDGTARGTLTRAPAAHASATVGPALACLAPARAPANLPPAIPAELSPTFPRPAPRTAPRTLAHFAPFALGPPASGPAPHRCAAGTSVPSDPASLRPPASPRFRSAPSFSFSFSSAARLACLPVPPLRHVDAPFRPSFALRGKPARSRPAFRRSRPPRASGAPPAPASVARRSPVFL